MKKSLSSFLLILTVFRFLEGAESFSGFYQVGMARQEAGNYAEAREEFEKALLVEGLTAAQVAELTFLIGDSYRLQRQWTPARAHLNKVLLMEAASRELKTKAHLRIAQINNVPWAWERARDSFLQALSDPGIPADLRGEAVRGLLQAFLLGRQYAAAREQMRRLIAEGDLNNRELFQQQLDVGRMSLYLREFECARIELSKALAIDAVSSADRADVRYHLALTYYDAGDWQSAKPLLEEVMAMPGAEARRSPGNYVPKLEARVRLHLRGWVETEQQTMKVMFVGSSHTIRGTGIPRVVEALAASAPPEYPRIVSGYYVRGGTTLDAFWEEGDMPGTARHLLATEPWDAVVLETFFRTSLVNRGKYSRLFQELAAAGNTRTVLYETPVSIAERVYPEDFRKFHQENVFQSDLIGAKLAPTVAAFVEYLGENPSPQRISELYADTLHASEKGYYLVACCIYAALTGKSPVGLDHLNLPPEEALALQRLAWQTYREIEDR